MLFSGCRYLQDNGAKAIFNPADFNPANVMHEIKALTAIGPRPSGSPAARQAAEHLLARLRAAGVEAVLEEFEEETPAGRICFRNVSGVLRGNDTGGRPVDKWVIIGAHYDTKSGIAPDFEGVNDSASGVCLMLELARVIKSSPHRPANFLFAFFDGEECLIQYGKNDGLHGSRRLARQLTEDGRAAKVRAVIILDMIGDRDLSVTIPRNSDPDLMAGLFKAAEAEGVRDKFSLWPGEILDDHAPFLAAGMPAIDIIDFEYGSTPRQNDYWHTPEDTIDKLSLESVEVVGKTVLRLLDDLTIKQKPHCK